jgi:hypothetical protein
LNRLETLLRNGRLYSRHLRMRKLTELLRALERDPHRWTRLDFHVSLGGLPPGGRCTDHSRAYVAQLEYARSIRAGRAHCTLAPTGQIYRDNRQSLPRWAEMPLPKMR